MGIPKTLGIAGWSVPCCATTHRAGGIPEGSKGSVSIDTATPFDICIRNPRFTKRRSLGMSQPRIHAATVFGYHPSAARSIETDPFDSATSLSVPVQLVSAARLSPIPIGTQGRGIRGGQIFRNVTCSPCGLALAFEPVRNNHILKNWLLWAMDTSHAWGGYFLNPRIHR